MSVVFAVAVVTATVNLVTRDDSSAPTSARAEAAESSASDPDDAEIAAVESGGTDLDHLRPIPTATSRPPYDGWVDPESSGEPQSETVAGLLTFRGNATRSWYGVGPVPEDPEVVWSYPAADRMCGISDPGTGPVTWCGTGWTGQPAVFEREGRTWAVFGAYDYNVHFVDAVTAEEILAPFPTGDIIKGSVSIDPDGFPLVYTGSRDNYLRVVAFDRDEPVELWALSADAAGVRKWNNDWDGSPLVIDDHLFVGGENSVFHIVKLNRGYDDDGLATVSPELVFAAPGWDADLIAAVGENVSIENSVAVSGDTVYFANSGGLVQGWDISGLSTGATPERVFRYWVGDDTDASVVVDDDGFLYVAVEYERGTARSNEIGQLLKLDPRRPDDPVVWGVFENGVIDGGFWATPAIHGDMLYASTNGGRLMGIDRATGEIVWEKRLPGPLWSSQVVVDDVLIQGDCSGVLHAFDVSNPRIDPPELWQVALEGCIESTPAMWNGRIIVGTRAGQVHMIADQA